MTLPEKKLWYDYLRTMGVPVLRQKPIDNFIVDFYIARAKLVIEVDGDSHFTDNGIVYDKQRTRILEGYGLKIVRFTNTQVMRNFRNVCSRIEQIVNPPSPL